MEELSEIKKRLLSFIDYINSNPNDFSVKIGMSRAYIRTLKDEISTKAMRNIILNFPQLNIYWLVDGRGEMIISEERNSINNESLTFYLKEENRSLKEENKLLLKENAMLLAKLELLKGSSSKTG